MFRIQVKMGKKWKWGWNNYETLAAAEKRLEELKAVGIQARIKPEIELLR